MELQFAITILLSFIFTAGWYVVTIVVSSGNSLSAVFCLESKMTSDKDLSIHFAL